MTQSGLRVFALCDGSDIHTLYVKDITDAKMIIEQIRAKDETIPLFIGSLDAPPFTFCSDIESGQVFIS